MASPSGTEKSSLNNIKALWGYITGAGAQAIRKAMGLGDTLGPLQPECGGTGLSMHGSYDCKCKRYSNSVDIELPKGLTIDDVSFICMIGFYYRFSNGNSFVFTGQPMPLKDLLAGACVPIGANSTSFDGYTQSNIVAWGGGTNSFMRTSSTTIQFSPSVGSWQFDAGNINKKVITGAAAWVIV